MSCFKHKTFLCAMRVHAMHLHGDNPWTRAIPVG